MTRILVVSVGAVAALMLTGRESVSAAEAATPARIVDRTFRCTLVAVPGGARELDIITKPRGGVGRGTLTSDPSVGYIGVVSGPQRLPGAQLVEVAARPEPRWQASTLPPGVYASAKRCRQAAVVVPLSRKGLPGPPIAFARDADCDVRGRVLIRVRAVLEGPTEWRRASPSQFGARRNVSESKIAVRSERTRRPLALLELGQTGETRLWTSSGCG
jgi:hypothetical protein